ncbi:MAG: cryptochrome/photolyase family protein [Aquiluna sp.]
MQLLFADQLGPHFELGDRFVLPIVKEQFRKRRYHRQKAHLILYALRSRAQDPMVQVIELENYRALLTGDFGITSAVNPTSYPFRQLVSKLGIDVSEARGFCSSERDWKDYAESAKKLKLEDFYRRQRTRLQILMDEQQPVGGQWNFDDSNRLPPTKEELVVPGPWLPKEDEIDKQVRQELNELERSGVRFIGKDGPRKFAGTREQALQALAHFIENRLDLFGPYEDAVDQRSWSMSHSLLSAPMNLGLLDPIEVVRAAENAYRSGKARLESVEGFIRQIIGWRDYVWHLYWHFGEGYTSNNSLSANTPLPSFMTELSTESLKANCISHTISDLSVNAWLHHIPRLMILGNHSMQRGYVPKEVNDWFIDAFVDGTPWVMPANTIGMSLYADGGLMSTKPYAAGGAYLSKMTNYCSDCPLNPKKRVGEDACPFTAGYWYFLDQNPDLQKNHRMFNAYAGLRKLTDIEQLREQEASRNSF